MRRSPATHRTPRRFAAAAVIATLTIPAGLLQRGFASPTPLPEDLKIVVSGGGWGHGHGMSQYGAYGQAAAGRTWQQIIGFYYRGVSIANIGNGAIRVLVSSGGAVVAGGEHPFTAKWSNGNTIAASSTTFPYMRVRPTSSGVLVERSSSPTSGWTGLTSGTLAVRFYPSDGISQLRLSNGQIRYYREMIEANRTSATTINAINQLSMDHYLYGVIGREMPSGWPAEALKAQAVAARSYSAWKRAHSSGAYNICATTSCQVYGGYAYRASASSSLTTLERPSTNSAVDATSGRAATTSGQPIFAEYHSSDGGNTGPGSQPYLAPVADPYDHVHSPYFRWTALVAVSSIEAHWPSLGRFVGISGVQRDGYGPWGGRVNQMTLLGTSANVAVSGSAFQSAFGLRSRLFYPGIYNAAVASSPGTVTLMPGQTTTVSLQLRNTGNVSWPIGGAVVLGTAAPLGHASRFATSAWQSSARPAALSRNLTRAGATSVAPGEVGEFRFPLSASGASMGIYHEAFRPVYGSTTWFGSVVPITIQIGDGSFQNLGGNVLQNASFEIGDSLPADWTLPGAEASDGRTLQSALGGAASLHFTGGAAKNAYASQSVTRAGSAGERFALSGWNRTVDSDPSAGIVRLYAAVRYDDGTSDFADIDFANAAHGWKYGSAAFTTTKAYARIDVYARYAYDTGDAWFDQLRLERNDAVNPGFEAGTSAPDGWSLVGAGTRRETTVALTGDASLHITGSPSVIRYATQKIARAGNAGDALTVSGWNRSLATNSSRGSISLYGAIRYQDGTSGFVSVPFPSAPHDWRYGQSTVTTTKPYTRIDLVARAANQTGEIWFDDVRLAPSDRTIVQNGGFEQGGSLPDSWSIPGAAASDGKDTSRALAGTASLRLAGSPSRNAYASQSIARSGEAGDTFIVSGWNQTASSSATGGKVSVYAAVRYADGSTGFGDVAFGRAPHGWQLGSAAFVATKPYTRIDVYARYAQQPGNAWFDEVRITPVDFIGTDNAGFEAGGTLPEVWSVRNRSGSDGRVTTIAQSGRASLLLTGASSKNAYAVQSVPWSGGAAERFSLSAWNRSVSSSRSGGMITAYVMIRYVDGTSGFQGITFPSGPHSWRFGQTSFRAAKAFSRIDVYARFPNQAGSAWFDDVALRPLA